MASWRGMSENIVEVKAENLLFFPDRALGKLLKFSTWFCCMGMQYSVYVIVCM